MDRQSTELFWHFWWRSKVAGSIRSSKSSSVKKSCTGMIDGTFKSWKVSKKTFTENF